MEHEESSTDPAMHRMRAILSVAGLVLSVDVNLLWSKSISPSVISIKRECSASNEEENRKESKVNSTCSAHATIASLVFPIDPARRISAPSFPFGRIASPLTLISLSITPTPSTITRSSKSLTKWLSPYPTEKHGSSRVPQDLSSFPTPSSASGTEETNIVSD